MSTSGGPSQRNRQIAVARGTDSVLENEFDSMRDRFEREMKRVEGEMERLRSEFDGQNQPHLQQDQTQQRQSHHHSSSYHTNTTTGGTHNTGGGLYQSTGADSNVPYTTYSDGARSQVGAESKPVVQPYWQNPQSPLIKNDSDGRMLRLRFNVKDYQPEEVAVKTIDNRLLVHAKHEERSSNRTVFREYNQEFLLPIGTDVELITSTLSTDGVLTVEAPLPPNANVDAITY